jgi:hypothetical protein
VTGNFQGTADFGTKTLTSTGLGDVFVAKLDTTGAVMWAQPAGGTSGDNGYGIAVDSSGTSHVVGHFAGTATFGSTTLTSKGMSDVFVTKLDSTGTFMWAQSAGGMSMEFGYGIALDGSGNSYVTGMFQATATFGTTTLTSKSKGLGDVFVARVDKSGQFKP